MMNIAMFCRHPVNDIYAYYVWAPPDADEEEKHYLEDMWQCIAVMPELNEEAPLFDKRVWGDNYFVGVDREDPPVVRCNGVAWDILNECRYALADCKDMVRWPAHKRK